MTLLERISVAKQLDKNWEATILGELDNTLKQNGFTKEAKGLYVQGANKVACTPSADQLDFSITGELEPALLSCMRCLINLLQNPTITPVTGLREGFSLKLKEFPMPCHNGVMNLRVLSRINISALQGKFPEYFKRQADGSYIVRHRSLDGIEIQYKLTSKLTLLEIMSWSYINGTAVSASTLPLGVNKEQYRLVLLHTLKAIMDNIPLEQAAPPALHVLPNMRASEPVNVSDKFKVPQPVTTPPPAMDRSTAIDMSYKSSGQTMEQMLAAQTQPEAGAAPEGDDYDATVASFVEKYGKKG